MDKSMTVLMRDFCRICTAFFALRPFGRRVPALDGQQLLGFRGLVGGGDAGSLTPRCSATLIGCSCAAVSTETLL